MSKSKKIRAIESKLGTLDSTIPFLLKEFHGNQRLVADCIGLSPAFISRWLRQHGYVQVVQWVKQESKECEPA